MNAGRGPPGRTRPDRRAANMTMTMTVPGRRTAGAGTDAPGKGWPPGPRFG